MLQLVSKNEIKLCLKRGTIKLINLESNGQVAMQIGKKIFYFADEDILLPVPEFIKRRGTDTVLKLLSAAINGPIYSQDDWDMIHFLKNEAFEECLATAKKLGWKVSQDIYVGKMAYLFDYQKTYGFHIAEADANKLLSFLLETGFIGQMEKLYQTLISEEDIFPKSKMIFTDLETILQKVHGTNMEMFDPALECEQNPEGFTLAGINAYRRLISLLNDIGKLTESNLNPVIEKLDAIALED